jgi:hypothetical protein
MKKKRRKKHPTAESSSATYTCPSCFEAVDTFPDPGGGSEQTYVEDCSLCCRPNVLRVCWDEDEGTWSIEASRES